AAARTHAARSRALGIDDVPASTRPVSPGLQLRRAARLRLGVALPLYAVFDGAALRFAGRVPRLSDNEPARSRYAGRIPACARWRISGTGLASRARHRRAVLTLV